MGRIRACLITACCVVAVACTAAPQPAAPAATATPPAAVAPVAKPTSSVPGRSAGKDALVVAIPSDIDNFDPPKSFGTPKTELTYNVYDQLVDFKLADGPGGLKVSDGDAWAPSLAERVEIGSDGVTYTFHLRRGVRFYPSGRELTAEDVRWSLERQMSLKVGLGKFEAGVRAVLPPQNRPAAGRETAD